MQRRKKDLVEIVLSHGRLDNLETRIWRRVNRQR